LTYFAIAHSETYPLFPDLYTAASPVFVVRRSENVKV